VAAEESLNRKYRLQPSAEVLGKHHEAATLLSTALNRARVLGEPADGALIRDVLAIHKQYLLAIDRMFAAVDAGDITRANEMDRTDVDPRFDKMEALVFAASDAHHATALRSLVELAYVQTRVLAVTICAFAIGMGLVVLSKSVSAPSSGALTRRKRTRPVPPAKVRAASARWCASNTNGSTQQ
jgi:hypothetical protein